MISFPLSPATGAYSAFAKEKDERVDLTPADLVEGKWAVIVVQCWENVLYGLGEKV